MKLKGTPLAEWGVRIHRGITTGLNDAFIIDRETRDRLIAEAPRSEEILKPILRGRDIRRFTAEFADLYLIAMHNGYDDLPPVDPDAYPAVKRHLRSYQPRLANRYDQGRTPFNLRSCAYHAEFAKEKLFWIDLSPEGRFAYWESEMYCINTAFFMTGPSLKYLQAVLNSTLMTWLVRKTALTSGMGELRWIAFVVEQLPVPKVALVQQQPLVQVVDDILAVKSADSSADIGYQTSEIDRLVYGLYGLTAEEVKAVEPAW